MARQTSQLVRALRQQGCRVEMGGGGHLKVWGPDGRFITTLSCTPGGHGRTFANAIACLKRAGIQV